MINPMDIYNKIKTLGPVATKAAEAFMGSLTKKYTKDNPAPPELIQKGLEGILAEHQPQKASSAPNPSSLPSGNMRYAYGLAGVLGLIVGVPYFI